eukprot:199277-Chlamydomonas_euryale.AAC.4
MPGSWPDSRLADMSTRCTCMGTLQAAKRVGQRRQIRSCCAGDARHAAPGIERRVAQGAPHRVLQSALLQMLRGVLLHAAIKWGLQQALCCQSVAQGVAKVLHGLAHAGGVAPGVAKVLHGVTHARRVRLRHAGHGDVKT